ncbi:1621_t:CDS:1, partial [Funneliformis geosporum]
NCTTSTFVSVFFKSKMSKSITTEPLVEEVEEYNMRTLITYLQN